MARKKKKPPADSASQEQQKAEPVQPSDQSMRIDEYVDDSYDVRELDALDVPYALRNESVLQDVPEGDGDGIEEVDVGIHVVDETVDGGVRRRARDEANMGLGAEPHSAEELEEAALGKAIPGDRGITRDDERHGHALLDEEPDERDELH